MSLVPVQGLVPGPGPALSRAFLGDALHTPVRGDCEMLTDVLIEVGTDGSILRMLRNDSPRAAATATADRHRAAGTLHTLAKGRLMVPGLVDLHVHAPQWPQCGLALDLPLEQWLQTHTFPLEARYADLEYADSVYESLVDGLLANGTTTAMYFATIHPAATQRLADICLRRAQRALIGRVAMDDTRQCPPYYRDASAAAALEDSRAFIGYVRSLPGNGHGLILPVVTPRFIPACTDRLLAGLGQLAQEAGCHIQTHCSESDWQHGHVLARCGVTDTAALAGFGLLSRRSILAHGNFIDDEDIALIVAAGAGIAHCPLSNIFFAGATFPLRRSLDRGVHVGLGTDLAGGSSPSIFDNLRQAIVAARTLESGVDARLDPARRAVPDSRIDAATALWLATAGGGIALDLPVGLFREGYQFDAVVIDTRNPHSNLNVPSGRAAEEVLQRIVQHASRADVSEVWVANRCVHRSRGTAADEAAGTDPCGRLP